MLVFSRLFFFFFFSSRRRHTRFDCDWSSDVCSSDLGAGALPLLAHARGGRVIRKREPRWQSAAERARVAAELIEEAESLTETSSIASPADVARARLPPPVTAQLPSPPPAAPPGDAPAPARPVAEPTLDDALAADPDNLPPLAERARLLASASHQRAALQDYKRAPRVDPIHR